MVMSLGSRRSEMGCDPRFGSGAGLEAVRPLFYWGSRQNETKWVFSGVSLGNPRASPPRIRLQTGGTRSISMGYAVQHFEWRQFFGNWSPFAPLRNTQIHYKNVERCLYNALSPSCLSDSMDLLQLSKGKVLQHFLQLQHSRAAGKGQASMTRQPDPKLR